MTSIEKLQDFINKSSNIVFFGGAGVSTESGIPDFRSENGLYTKHDISVNRYEPEYLLSKSCLYNNTKIFYKYYRENFDLRKAEPNICHNYLYRLEECGKLKAIITQNVDGLHQKAGSTNVIEIHGSINKCHCVRCNKDYSGDAIFDSKDNVPRCNDCYKMLRPDIVLYHEKLDNNDIKSAMDYISNADMLLIAGTSLQVYPAAHLIDSFQGNHLVILNKEKIDMLMNPETDLQINESLGDIFSKLTI